MSEDGEIKVDLGSGRNDGSSEGSAFSLTLNVAAVGTALIALGWLYNYGYFRPIGLQLFGFVGLEDYLKSFANSAILLMVVLVINASTLDRDGLVQALLQKRRLSGYYLVIFIVMSLCGIDYVMDESTRGTWGQQLGMAILLFLWLRMVIWRRNTAQERQQIMLLMTIIILVGTFSFGYNDGRRVVTDRGHVCESGAFVPVEKLGRLCIKATFSDFVIASTQKNDIVFLSREGETLAVRERNDNDLATNWQALLKYFEGLF